MDYNTRSRLLKGEEDFLSAFASGAEAIELFDHQWQLLLNDLQEYTSDESTVAFAQPILSRVAVLSRAFVDIETTTEVLTNDAYLAFDSALEGALPQASSSGCPKSVDIAPDFPSPSAWLLQNLHNPYPSPALKTSMHQSGHSKSVNGWFTKARQRIGWTRVLRDHFGGSRSETVSAAFRAYIRDDPANPLDPELLSDFMDIKACAQRVLLENRAIDDDDYARDSHDRSRSISPVPSLAFSSTTDDSEDDAPSLSTIATGRKRSISRSSSDERPLKRYRSRSLVRCSVPDIQLPDSSIVADQAHTCHKDTPVIVPRSTVSSKKRRTSVATTGPVPKRPRGLENTKPHVVSDPFPRPSAGSEDFFEAFKTPSPAFTSTYDPQSLNPDIFNVITFPEYENILSADSSTNNSYSSLGSNPYAAIDIDLPSFLSSPSLLQRNNPAEFSWNEFFDLDTASDTSCLASQPSPAPSPEFNFNIPSTLPYNVDPAVQPSKLAFDLNPMLQAFSDFFSTTIDPAMPKPNVDDERLIEALLA